MKALAHTSWVARRSRECGICLPRRCRMHKHQRAGRELEAYRRGTCHKPRKWQFLAKKEVRKEAARQGTRKTSKWLYIPET